MTEYISYDWVINYKNRFLEQDWLCEIVCTVGGKIRYQIRIDNRGYHIMTFIVEVESSDIVTIFICATERFLDVDKWHSMTSKELENSRPLIPTSELHSFQIANQFDRLWLRTETNIRARKRNILKNIIMLQFRQVREDLHWLIEFD